MSEEIEAVIDKAREFLDAAYRRDYVGMKAALESGGVDPAQVNAVVSGNVISCSTIDTPLVSRHVGLR